MGRASGMVIAAVVVLGACGGNTTGGGTASGLRATRGLADLTQPEVQQLCQWYIQQLGGDGATYECPDGSFTIRAQDFECDEPPPSECTATVSDVEACAREERSALETCDPDGRDGPACQRLEDLCGDGRDDVSGPVAQCVPGATFACACEDGSSGTQVCEEDGTLGACECQGSDLLCVPGEMLDCSCADGGQGVQVCAMGGQSFGPCECEPSGTCNPSFCPATSSGTPCCVGPEGPCGVDVGRGCQSETFAN